MNLEFPSSLINDGVKPIIDLRDKLPVNPAYTWEELCGKRDPEALSTIVIHHDALPKAKFNDVSDIELATRIANGHIHSTANEPKGDAGFPYDCWIRKGQAYQCNDLLPLKYGVASNNTYTLHVCVSGEYKHTDALTDDDRKTAIAVVLMLLSMKDDLPNLKDIKGHCELNATSCPGFDIDQFRNDVLDTKHRIESNNTLDAKRGRAYLVAQQTQYLYSLVGKNDGDETWALSYFERFYELMKQEGWFK